MLDGVKFGEEIVGLVRGFVEREVAPLKAANEALTARVAELEAKQTVEIDVSLFDEALDARVAALPVPQDGVSPDPETVAAALLPLAEETIAEAVQKAVAALPAPERGEKGDPGERGEKGEPGSDGTNGRDGAGIVDGFLSREGHLVATLSDGTTRDFGEVVGKDGRDGKDGENGRDGFGFDDLDVCVLDDDRTIELSFRKGEEEKAFTLKWPTVVYRGVWRAADGEYRHTYSAGDAVTWGGSMWVAEKETSEKPDAADSGWRLAVKKGRDGKDARKDS